MKRKNIIEELLYLAGIKLNGNAPWDLKVYNEQFYRDILKNTEIAFGESYMDKWWDCSHLDELIYKILQADLKKIILKHPKFWINKTNQLLYGFSQRLFNQQTKSKSLIVGKQHYDIDITLYKAMLDKRMVYTCAYWEGVDNLDAAQENKLALTCKKLNLQPGMSVLDIGCGWGSFAKYAAEKYQVSVTGITISHEQCNLGNKLCAGLPVEIRFEDYRNLLKSNKKYDRIVSLGMFEHVGYKNYVTYMQTAEHCLKEDGLFLLHTIGANRSNQNSNSWINKYIFPHGQLPTIQNIAASFEGIFVMEDWHNFGVHYDKTLLAWHQNFNQHWDEIKHKYDERFRRMWNFYLLSCAASFRARQNQLWQIVLSKKGLPSGFQR